MVAPVTRTPFFVRNQPGGMIFVEDYERAQGISVFVDSANGVDVNGYGFSPVTPVATLTYAAALCTADRGDRIFLAPGHAETKAATGNIALVEAAGIEIIGLGRGAKRPLFTLGHAGATFSITGANVLLRNVKILSAIADCAVGLTLGAAADGAEVCNCDFFGGAVAVELVIGISIAAACHNVHIHDNRFVVDADDAGGCAQAILAAGACDYARIMRNYIQGNFTASPIDFLTAKSVGIIIDGNSVFNTDTAAGLGIGCKSDTTGHVVRNLVTNAKDTVPGIVAAACHVAQNYYSNAAGASGRLGPAVDS